MLKGFVSGEEKDIKRIPMKGKNLANVNAWKNTSSTDTRTSLNLKIELYNGNTLIAQKYKNVTETGAFSVTTNSIEDAVDRIILKHAGWTRDINIFEISGAWQVGTLFSLAANCIGYDPTIINGIELSNIMFNEGSTPLPYEPYGYQEGWEVRDNQDRLIWGREDELQTATGTLPFKGYGLPVKPKSLLGNAVQNGTPAPDNIITPEMCGKKVGDDWTIPLTNAGQTVPIYLGEVPTVRRVRKLVLTSTTSEWTYDSTYNRYAFRIADSLVVGVRLTPVACSHFVPITDGRSIGDVPNNAIYSNSKETPNNWFIKTTDYTTASSFKQFLDDELAAGHPVTIWYVLANEQTGISNEPLCKISTYADELTTIQVHGLSAPLYGIGDYKDTLNLSTGVITRKIKKLVLTGEENIEIKSGNAKWYIPIADMKTPDNFGVIDWYCSHYQAVSNSATWTSYDYMISWSTVDSGLSIGLRIRDIDFLTSTTAAEFQSYLAAQYQAGTPVTIWYVLSTPTTETVTVPTGMTGEIEGYLTQVSTPSPTNRSVPKWNGVEETGGTYAVTVYTPPEIPTTTGQNTLTVETEKIHGLTNPLCGIGDYKDTLNLSTGVIARKIKKLVLDGTESSWFVRVGNTSTFGVYLVGRSIDNPGMCSHYIPINAADFGTSTGFYVRNTGTLYVSDPRFTDISDFQAFLAAQYQNGTPVTVWYVPTEPETETITVPYGLECSVEGYLTQSTTPTPSSPITPDSNGILESGGTYAVEVSLVPSNLTVKGHIKELT